MPTYKVTLHRTVFYQYEVEADDEQAAEDDARELLELDDEDDDGSAVSNTGDVGCSEVEEIK